MGMEEQNRKNKLRWVLLLCLFGVGLNNLGSLFVQWTGIPLYLDSIGSFCVAVLGGYLPAVAVGFVSNFIKSLSDNAAVYYGTLNVMMSVCCAWFARRGYWKKWYKLPIIVVTFTMIGGALGSILTWFLYGFSEEGISVPLVSKLYETGKLSKFWAQMFGDVIIDFFDKVANVIIVLGVTAVIPQKIKKLVYYEGWQQRPLSRELKEKAKHTNCRRISLRSKLVLLISIACFIIAIVATSIGYILYRQSTINDHTDFAQGVVQLSTTMVDPEKVDAYIEKGEAEPGYTQTLARITKVRESSENIVYLYFYKILDDGCQVVFDVDTDDVPGDKPGTKVDFDPAFADYLEDMKAGREIEPVLEEKDGRTILTVYHPVLDKSGKCVCYAIAEVSMDALLSEGYTFLVKQLTLFVGFFILILTVGLWMAEFGIIFPINSMAEVASAFAYNSDEARKENIKHILDLGVRTGDEVENLYLALAKTTEDSMAYVEDIENKTETISQMQSGLIMVLADLVESRDKCTGDHVRKTAAYAGIILNQMRKEGMYPDQLTDKFVADVIQAAPLHDVGKIHVPDAILNKPGKLTDEEFEKMKEHTIVGERILNQAIDIVPDSGYLDEAKRLATYHHEKWNGRGYPKGLAGDEIPLSARIMAVADVFDALVSNRSYKKGFPFDQAMEIIEKDAGTHFDPLVVKAFLDAREEVYQVATEFGELNTERMEDFKADD